MILLSSAGGSIWQLIVVLFIFVAILGVTYWVTKWIAGYQKQTFTGKNLEIIETVRISPNKVVQIIRAGKDKYFVLASGKDEVIKVGELSSEDIVPLPTVSSNVDMPDFKSILSKLSKSENNK